MKKLLITFLILSITIPVYAERLSTYPTRRADKIKIEDDGNYYDGRDNVEDALQAIGTGDVVDVVRGNLTIHGNLYTTGTSGTGGTATADTVTADIIHATSRIDIGSTPFGTLQKDGSNNLVLYDPVTGAKTLAQLAAGAAGGDAWSDAVDSDILPTGADNTYDLGSDAASFADIFWDGTATGDVVDAQFFEYSSGGAITVRDNLALIGYLSGDGDNEGININADGDVTVSARFITAPVATQSITSAADTIGSASSTLSLDADADYVMTSTPTITAATAGTILVLHNKGAFDIDLQANSILAGSTIYNEGVDSILEPNDVMTLMYFDDADGSGNPGWRVQSHPNPTTAAGSAEQLDVRNVSGSTIAAFTPVYATGWNAGQVRTTVAPADSDDSNKMPAIGLTVTSIENNRNGQIITFGEMMNVNTSAFAVDTLLYVSATVGELTVTRPSVDDVQTIGEVLRSHATQGVFLVTGAGRANDTDNEIVANNITLSATATADVVDTSRVENSSGQLSFNDTTTGVKTLAQLAASGAGAPDQNLWETIDTDGTSVAANSTTDTLTLAGGGINETSQSGDTITITGTEAQDLDDVTNISASTTNDIDVGDINDFGVATGDVVDTQYIEYSSGGAVTVRDDLTVNGSVTGANVTTGTDPGHIHSASSITETDPIVGAVSGIVKADGGGNISAASADTDYLVTLTGDLVTTSPITGGVNNIFPGSGTKATIAINDAQANDTTKGAATFEADDFDDASGKIDLADTIVKSVSTDGSAATPSSHAFTIAGSGINVTSGSGATVTVTGTEAQTLDAVIQKGATTSTSIDVGDIDDFGSATGDVVDVQYLEYSTGGAVMVRDDLQVNEDVLINTNRRYVGYEDIDFAISQPDSINTEKDEMPIFHVDADKYPSGIKVVNVQASLSENATYNLGYYEADNNQSISSLIATVDVVTAKYKEILTSNLNDADVASDGYIFIKVPSNDISYTHGKVIFYAK